MLISQHMSWLHERTPRLDQIRPELVIPAYPFSQSLELSLSTFKSNAIVMDTHIVSIMDSYCR
jgi:hypothetical protein